jgi:uncharacterized protein YqeY
VVSLQERVQDGVRDAMRHGDVHRRDALRLLQAALQNEPIERVGAAIQSERLKRGRDLTDEELQAIQAEQGRSLTEEEETAVITRLVKRHRDSIEHFRRAGRDDLVGHEEAQLAAISAFLPVQMHADEVERRVRAAIAETGAASRRDMGKVIGRLAGLRGKADMAQVSKVVQSLLPS